MKKFLLILMCLLMMVGCSSGKKNDSSEITGKSGAVYEIYVGSFNDSNGDGKGDLNGVSEKLDYIEELGASDIWLMPIFTSSSYHKYDVEDYYAIDPQYGTMEDLQNLIAKMHEKGMKLYLDLVVNHTSSLHPWFKAAVSEMQTSGYNPDGYSAYYNWSDHPQNGYNSVSTGLFYECQFAGNMPDLNLYNVNVREEIKKIAEYYLNMGVDGFRLDASLHYFEGNNYENVAFLRWFNETCNAINPDCYLVSEVWTDFSTVIQYYRSGIDSLFNFGLSAANGSIVSAIKRGNGQGLAEIMADYNRKIKLTDYGCTDALFLSNHDQARSAGFFTDEQSLRLAAAVYLLSPGKPFIYYGEEIGLKGSGRDENKRMAMLWGEGKDCNNPDQTDYRAQVDTDVKRQNSDKNSLLNYYRSLLTIRRKYPFITEGRCVAVNLNDESLFCQKVFGDGNIIYVVHNFSAEKKTFEFNEGNMSESTNSANRQDGNMFTMEPYSSIVMELPGK